jgi:DNA modification methylase
MNTLNYKMFWKSSEDMSELNDNSIDLVITSPPYYNYKDYGVEMPSTYAGYKALLKRVFTECYRVLKPGSIVCINTTNMKSRTSVEKDSFLYPIVADTILIMQDIGFKFFDEIIWVKGNANNGALKGKPLFGSYPYPPTPKILDSIFENILIFKKSGKRYHPPKEVKEQSKLTKEEWVAYTKGIWFIGPDRNSKHPATFPIEIPLRLIKMYSFIGETVLDPFAGTGTTIVASVMLDRKGVGYELNREYEKEFSEKLENIYVTNYRYK